MLDHWEVLLARRRVVDLVDDLDRGPADEVVAFGLDNIRYEIDLSAVHADQLRDRLSAFVSAARYVGGKKPVRVSVTLLIDPKTVRRWAAHRGIKLSSHGRIPDEIIQQFQDAGH